jgi:glycosyltransferase involved in cell wall biosynthesis
VQLEAMCCRKPVVSTELETGTSFVNLNQETGLTVKPNDVESLSKAMNYLIQNPDQRKRFGESGYRRATQFFTSEKMVDNTLKLYEEVIQKDRRPNRMNKRVLRGFSDLIAGGPPIQDDMMANVFNRNKIRAKKSDYGGAMDYVLSFFDSRRKDIACSNSSQHGVLMKADQRYRVLHIITRLIVGGAQENTLYSAEMIDKNTFDTDVLSGTQTGPEGSLIADAKRRSISLILEPYLVREINPFKDLLALLRIIKLLKKRKYHIVHTHSSKAGMLGRLAAWITRTPVIVHTIHGWSFHSFQLPMTRLLFTLAERIVSSFTDKMIAVSKKDVYKGIKEKIGVLSDYVIIRSGIDISRYQNPIKEIATLKERLGIPKNAKVVGTVTRLSPQKSPLTFIHAAYTTLKLKNDIFFVIVGDGPLRPEIEYTAAQLGISERLIMTGIRDDVPDLLAIFDVFLLTSLWEGLPRVIPQAMAAGVPVIASRVDGNSEIIKDHHNGILVEPNDYHGISNAIVELLENPDKYQKICFEAQKNIEEYSVVKMVAQLKNLYLSLVEKVKAVPGCKPQEDI